MVFPEAISHLSTLRLSLSAVSRALGRSIAGASLRAARWRQRLMACCTLGVSVGSESGTPITKRG